MTIHGVRATWEALLLACNTATPASVSAPPPAVTRAHGDEASLASVTLTAEARERLGVTTAAVAERPLRRTRTLPGEVVARPGGVVMITAPVAGLVLAAGGLPRVGSEVIGGQPIARLIPLAAVDRDLRAQAQSRIAAADARLIVGNSRVERAEKLIGSGAGSQRAAEDARVERDIAAAELKAAQARLRMIDRTALSSDVATILRAPFHAVVRQVQVADGQAVAGGASLIELVNAIRRGSACPCWPASAEPSPRASSWSRRSAPPCPRSRRPPSPARPRPTRRDDQHDGPRRPGHRAR